MTTLIIAEHDGSALQPAVLHTLTAAQKIGGDVHVLVVGANAAAAAKAAASIPGVTKVLHADAPHFANPTAENVAAAAASNPVARTVMTLMGSAERTVASTLPA